jgi:hypothetical protein
MFHPAASTASLSPPFPAAPASPSSSTLNEQVDARLRAEAATKVIAGQLRMCERMAEEHRKTTQASILRLEADAATAVTASTKRETALQLELSKIRTAALASETFGKKEIARVTALAQTAQQALQMADGRARQLEAEVVRLQQVAAVSHDEKVQAAALSAAVEARVRSEVEARVRSEYEGKLASIMSSIPEAQAENTKMRRDLAACRVELDKARMIDNARRKVEKMGTSRQAPVSTISDDDPSGGPPELPDELKCPITYRNMIDPVVAADTYTYERKAIETWLVQRKTSPMVRGVVARGACGAPAFSAFDL